MDAYDGRWWQRGASTTALLIMALVSSLAVAPHDAAAEVATVDAAASGQVTHTRLAGTDRADTAARIARRAFPAGGVTTAIIVRGDAFPDAVAAATLAGAERAPVLLVDPEAVPPATSAALDDLGVQRVVILGGPDAVSSAVEAALRVDHEVERVAGTDRYRTAAAVARRAATAADVGAIGGERTAIIVSGQSFPDALTAGPLAYARRLPLLLTQRGQLHPASRAAIDDLGIRRIKIVGGPGAVSVAVATELTEAGLDVERIQGADRTATAAALATAMVNRWGFDPAAPLVARGDAFPDALAAAVLAGEGRAPILLTGAPSRLSGPASTWLRTRCPGVSAVRIVGGTSAVTPAVLVRAVRAAEACTAEPVRAVWIHAFDGRLKARSSIRATVQEAADAGANRLIVQVVRRHDAYHVSSVLPRTPDPTLASGLDVLAETIAAAHPRGIAVEAWMTVGPTYHAAYDDVPHPRNWVWTRHGRNAPVVDRWVTRDVDGAWSIYLDPGVPAVATHVAAVVSEIAARYPVDGIHLDYVRYDGERWGYHPRALSRFRAETGRTGTPSPRDAEWSRWRRAQVDRVLRTAANAVWKQDPWIDVTATTITWGQGPTAAGGFARTRAHNDTFQDWPRWAEREYVDALYPMAYFRDDQHRAWFNDWNAFSGRLHRETATDVAVGIGAYLNPVDAVIRQMTAAEAVSGGSVIYSWQQPTSGSRAEAVARIRQHWVR